ncbi:hypothetical protein P3W85_14565 [Cupriavidus basilensis]|uniref:Suppressor of fused domain protein n=1 Tax=Cupriavidus basilensis TaxID=68895 RepID=A0ABT6ANH5_9BURK|nr:hypothetical protein [Cupriavidus basilensis]MDF3834169.1 hypothetical protein [Cupriavidus basilensis]
MRWWERLLGEMQQNTKQDAHAPDPALGSAAAPVTTGIGDNCDAATQAMLEATANSRDAFYASLGALEPDVLAPLINPALMGGPTWPALRQAWSVIRRPDSTAVASNGLSDPFEQTNAAPVALGFGIEVFAEARGQIAEMSRSWLFDLTYQVSQNVASHGQCLDLLARYGVLSMLLEVKGLPLEWLSGEGKAGVLIGLPAKSVPATFDTPYGEVRMVALTLLRPEELAFLETSEEISVNRRWLAENFASVPDGHVNDLGRSPFVTA